MPGPLEGQAPVLVAGWPTSLSPLLKTTIPLMPPGAVDFQIVFDDPIPLMFSEPLAIASVDATSVRVTDPDGYEIEVSRFFGVGDASLTIQPARNLRLGASYTVHLSSGIEDLNGETFPGADFRVFVRPPEMADRIELSNALDVALVGDVLVAGNHPFRLSEDDTEKKGELHVYRVWEGLPPVEPLSVRERVTYTQLLPEAVEIAGLESYGMPRSMAAEGDRLYVGNRYLGPILQKGLIPINFPVTSLTSLAINLAVTAITGGAPIVPYDSFPTPPSNLQIFDLEDPAQPELLGANFLNQIRTTPVPAFGSILLWAPDTWTQRVEMTKQGVAVLSMGENIEMFSRRLYGVPPLLGPISYGVVERIYDWAQEPGRCDGSPYGSPCVSWFNWLAEPPFECAPCLPTDEFYDAAFFDGFAVTTERGGLRFLSTLLEDLEGGVLGRDRTIGYIPMPNGTHMGRVGGVSGYQWTDAQGGSRVGDLLFHTNPYRRSLTILDVTNPQAPAQLSEILDTSGNMSFDVQRGVVFLHGYEGEFHIIDFKEPHRPVELNDPNPEAMPFSVYDMGPTYSWNGNTNRNGAVFLANEAGVTIVQTRPPKYLLRRLGCLHA